MRRNNFASPLLNAGTEQRKDFCGSCCGVGEGVGEEGVSAEYADRFAVELRQGTDPLGYESDGFAPKRGVDLGPAADNQRRCCQKVFRDSLIDGADEGWYTVGGCGVRNGLRRTTRSASSAFVRYIHRSFPMDRLLRPAMEPVIDVLSEITCRFDL